MWIMTTFGAFSVVARDPKHTGAGDERTMVVRARQKVWLDELRKRYMPALGPAVHYKGADYQWHAAVEPKELALGVARIALDAGRYRNFKSATTDPRFGLKTAKLRDDLHWAYAKCWSALLSIGDGKSAYDWPSGLHGADEGTIDNCARLGHWYGVKSHKCVDCGTPRPAGVTGSQGGKPARAEVDAWWRARGGRKARRARKAPAAGAAS